jgi:2-phosphoglycerate kinase
VADCRIFLIGGSSHAGKSTLAQSLASHLKGNYCSTDKLARHPGRPWQAKAKDIPNHVVNHFQSLSAKALVEDVLQHYTQNVWPLIEETVALHGADTLSKKLVMEGSALLPELVITLGYENIVAVWLTASNEFLRQRIYSSSQYETKSSCEKMLVDKFVQRNCLYNDRIVAAVDRLGLTSLNVEDAPTLEELVSRVLSEADKNISL